MASLAATLMIQIRAGSSGAQSLSFGLPSPTIKRELRGRRKSIFLCIPFISIPTHDHGEGAWPRPFFCRGDQVLLPPEGYDGQGRARCLG